MKPSSHIHAVAINGAEVSIYTRVPFNMTLGFIPLTGAPFLAAELLRAYGVGKLGPYIMACPRCGDGLVNIIWYPGAPGRHTMSNGDPGYPPEPSYVDDYEATCGCWDEDMDEDHPLMRFAVTVVLAYLELAAGDMERAMNLAMPPEDEEITDAEIDRQLAQRHGDGVQSPEI